MDSNGKTLFTSKHKETELRKGDDHPEFIHAFNAYTPPATVEGDLVYVPQGMTLFVDQSTPQLEGIVVENGKLIFADEANM